MNLYVGIDNTDLLAGMCTTYVGIIAIQKSSKRVYHEQTKPKHISFNELSGEELRKRITLKWIITTILIFIVVAAVISRGMNEKKLEELPEGPKINLSQLITGFAVPLPGTEVGATAIYGIYIGKSKVGALEIRAIEKTTFQGTESFKAKITMTISYVGIEFTGSGQIIYGTDLKPRYFTYTHDSVFAECVWNYTKNTLRYRIATPTFGTREGELNLPELDGPENFYVGYSRQFTYDINGSLGTVTVSVPGEEDVTVPKGTYHCYVVRSSALWMDAVAFQTTWIDERGIVPQMEISVLGWTITMKLEYYDVVR